MLVSKQSVIASSYRRRLLPALLLLSAFACALLGAAAAWRQLVAAAHEQGVQSVILAARMADYVTHVKTQAQLAAASLAIEGSRETTENYLRRVLSSELSINLITKVSESGAVRVSLNRLQISPTVATGAIELAPPFGLRIASEQIPGAVDIAFTYRAARNYSTWIAGTLSATRISESMLEYGVQNGADVYLIGAMRQLVAHPNTMRVSRKERMTRNGSSWHAMLAGESNKSALTVDSSGALLLTSSSPVPGTPWVLIVERPASKAVIGLSDVLVVTLTAISLAAIIAWFASRQLSETIASPILLLTKFADGVEAGDFSSVPHLNRNDEIGRLSSTLASMASTIEQNYRQLDEKIAVRTRDLASANSALQAISRHKSEFLANMSHELRTPLNAVIGFSEMLKAQYFGRLNEKQAEYVKYINDSGQHLLALINEILDLAKVEAGRMELVRSNSHVPFIVEACCTLVSERFQRKRQTLDAVVEPSVSFWYLDERKFKQCLLNLLSNANKFTPEGGRVVLRVFVDMDSLVVRVTDTGVGIAPDALPKLFSEFYQVASNDPAAPTQAVSEGTGLGLALTKKFVELHGGTVDVTSVIGKGSVFTLRFPAGAPEATEGSGGIA